MPTYEAKKFDEESYTLLIDGQPTLKFWPKCNLEGHEETYYVDRVITRLKEGRSEVFGGPKVMMGTQQVTNGKTVSSSNTPVRASIKQVDPQQHTHTSSSGKEVTRELPRYKYILDGEDSEETYQTEKEAKEACACKAWLTSGKLGRLEEAKQAFQASHDNQECEMFVCPERHTILARSQDKEYSVGFNRDNTISFKELQQQKQPQQPQQPQPQPHPEQEHHQEIDISAKPTDEPTPTEGIEETQPEQPPHKQRRKRGE